MKKIVLTGGGTAGHVNPNIALIPNLQQAGWEISYMGSREGIEQKLVAEVGIPFYGIASGKLRRYLDLQNFTDPFKVIKGIAEAYVLLGKLKPNVIFSKGGFVTVPAIVAGWLRRIPVVIHESDFSPGLANKIAIPFASQICVSFPETLQYLPQATCTGLPIREEVTNGSAEQGRTFCNFNSSSPVLMVVGGSTGSGKINSAIRAILDRLIAKYQVVHLCGAGNLDNSLQDLPNYRQFEYLSKELPDVLAMADLVVSRAGANAVFELLATKKPNLLIPLSKVASRGDQILNAQSFAQLGYSVVLPEEELTPASLYDSIQQLYERRQIYTSNMATTTSATSIAQLIAIIEQVAK